MVSLGKEEDEQDIIWREVGRMRFENDRLTGSVIDFEFPEVDYQNPEASGRHLARVSLKRGGRRGVCCFRTERALWLEPVEITDDDGRKLASGRS